MAQFTAISDSAVIDNDGDETFVLVRAGADDSGDNVRMGKFGPMASDPTGDAWVSSFVGDFSDEEKASLDRITDAQCDALFAACRRGSWPDARTVEL